MDHWRDFDVFPCERLCRSDGVADLGLVWLYSSAGHAEFREHILLTTRGYEQEDIESAA